ncbi:MAG: lipase secretion chaperone [Sutterellaceae bacterium]|nr:hypothetical protein [Burkholderiaceae bacterium]MCX7902092.1 hypothetical protein [Burkholderiaceae bacterium]MDW8429302.1 lipase secretion chaperone [Sutterellaceae bacterium]
MTTNANAGMRSRVPRMSTLILTGLGVLAGGLAVALYLHREQPAGETVTPFSAAPASAAQRIATPEPDARPQPSAASSIPQPVPGVDGSWREAVANTGERFMADAQGRLVLNEKTRQRIEALVALVEPDQLPLAIAEETRHLPPEAAQQARDLVERFRLYLEEQIAVVPPGHAPAHEDEALAQLEAMERLRIARFGAATAKALFGAETEVARELIELMRLEKDPKLSMEQKAERAQARYLQLRQARESAQTPAAGR